MRNDARPIGEDSPASPIGGDAAPDGREHRGDEPSKPHEDRGTERGAGVDAVVDDALLKERPRIETET